ncbi:hypothetical protein CONPUDRAFT_163417 [Coniophora puteana RWD-64-598 SS2]|uniref:Uncharacterized protein n=1 Tax=Coniophora puteana (strain RWD-64-598) TaxID=741705 RepID=A0A5M3MYM8_CONPW|nr:uncharacterized protein CONPUDRAFT_163417 [Coniophora puteana RWD-64-598 SS2]EIW84240.1 hypothetical protein CONPUDRAFT_163417 [Coniophora puteana RWD-64-598 SS2]
MVTGNDWLVADSEDEDSFQPPPQRASPISSISNSTHDHTALGRQVHSVIETPSSLSLPHPEDISNASLFTSPLGEGMETQHSLPPIAHLVTSPTLAAPTKPKPRQRKRAPGAAPGDEDWSAQDKSWDLAPSDNNEPPFIPSALNTTIDATNPYESTSASNPSFFADDFNLSGIAERAKMRSRKSREKASSKPPLQSTDIIELSSDDDDELNIRPSKRQKSPEPKAKPKPKPKPRQKKVVVEPLPSSPTHLPPPPDHVNISSSVTGDLPPSSLHIPPSTIPSGPPSTPPLPRANSTSPSPSPQPLPTRKRKRPQPSAFASADEMNITVEHDASKDMESHQVNYSNLVPELSVSGTINDSGVDLSAGPSVKNPLAKKTGQTKNSAKSTTQTKKGKKEKKGKKMQVEVVIESPIKPKPLAHERDEEQDAWSSPLSSDFESGLVQKRKGKVQKPDKAVTQNKKAKAGKKGDNRKNKGKPQAVISEDEQELEIPAPVQEAAPRSSEKKFTSRGDEQHRELEESLAVQKENLGPQDQTSLFQSAPPKPNPPNVPTSVSKSTPARPKSTPMSELIRRANSHPSSPFASSSRGRYSPMIKSSRSMLSRMAPLHPNRRTPPPPPPRPPPPKKSKKQLQMEERIEEELSETIEGWSCMTDEERRDLRRARIDAELGFDD